MAAKLLRHPFHPQGREPGMVGASNEPKECWLNLAAITLTAAFLFPASKHTPISITPV